jgi:tricarballylate dehydrogenase
VVYNGVEDIKTLVPDLTQAEIDTTDFGTYTADQFFDDMARVTQHRANPDLVELLVTRSFDTLNWMREKGVRFIPIYGRQAFKIEGKFKFWGGLTVESVGGGPGLVNMLTEAAKKRGIEIRYRTRALDLLTDGDRVNGVRIRHDGQVSEIHGKAVVLASGGFQANPEWRTRYLGPGWDLAKVRGTRFNTGDGIRMALDIGASPCGNWSGCHAVGWEMNAPEFGDLAVGDQFQKHSYPFAIMVNATGKRFVDEGADFRNYTYAKYGRVILEQPGQFAWQIFDQKVKHLQRDEYRIRQITKVTANTIEELAGKLEGVNAGEFVKTIAEWNKAVKQDIPFDPNVKDGRRTEGLAINKSNWANTVDQPPYEGYAVTCGITFTFGGLRVNTDCEVLNTDYQPIRGLYAAGELVGGIFYFNYPGGSGLCSGAVFGKIAGTSAGRAKAN